MKMENGSGHGAVRAAWAARSGARYIEVLHKRKANRPADKTGRKNWTDRALALVDQMFKIKPCEPRPCERLCRRAAARRHSGTSAAAMREGRFKAEQVARVRVSSKTPKQRTNLCNQLGRAPL